LIDRKERKKNRTSRLGFVTGANPIPERASDGSPPRSSPAEPRRIPWSATVEGGRGVLLGGAARGSREEERERKEGGIRTGGGYFRYFAVVFARNNVDVLAARPSI
jgi:hypothetical protein